MLIMTIIAGNVAFLVGRYSRRFRISKPKPRVPAVMFLAVGLIGMAGLLALANRPTTSTLSGEFCGSPLKARTSTDFMCAEDLKVARSIAILTGEVGVGSLVIWTRRRRSRDARLVVVPVALALMGVGAVPALATQHEFDKWSAFKPSPVAQPAANAICAAFSDWGSGMFGIAKYGDRLGKGALTQRRDAAVEMMQVAEDATTKLFADFDRIDADFEKVAGVTPFVAILRSAWAPVKAPMLSVVDRAHNLSIASEAAFNHDKDKLAQTFSDAGNAMTMPPIPDDPEAAVVAATMSATPNCFFPG